METMKKLAAVLVLTLSSPLLGYEISGSYGDFIQCDGSDVVTAVCGSGEHADCVDENGNNVFTTIECKNENSILKLEESGDVNGWKCGEYGTHLTCPSSQALSGICGSGEHADCKLNCGVDSFQAILCGDVEEPYAVSSQNGLWKDPTKYGVSGSCTNGTVACGSCSSGKHADCDGMSNRIMCCPFIDCTPTDNIGQWNIIKSGSSANEEITFHYGVELTGSVELSDSVTHTYEKSVAAGFSFVHLGASVSVSESYSETVSQQVSGSFSVTIDATTSAHCDFAPYVLWQFTLESDGACPGSTFTDAYACTANSARPPCCLPGYSLDSEYRMCIPGSPNVCKAETM